MATTFNMFDIIFFVLSFIFILVAFFRGFIKELFALINWVITISLSYLITPYAAKFVAHYSQNPLVINVASGAIVFVVIFIMVFLATRGLAHDWRDKMNENLDRVFGVFFGVFKSLLIFGIFFAFTNNFYESLIGDNPTKKALREKYEAMPDWMTSAKCYPIVKFSGSILQPIIGAAVDGMIDKLIDADVKKNTLDDKIDDVIDGEDLGDEEKGVDGAGAMSEKPSSAKSKNKSEKKADEKYKDTGYSKKEIEKMNRLIEIVN